MPQRRLEERSNRCTTSATSCSERGASSQDYDSTRLDYVLNWIDNLEVSAAYLRGELWTQTLAPRFERPTPPPGEEEP